MSDSSTIAFYCLIVCSLGLTFWSNRSWLRVPLVLSRWVRWGLCSWALALVVSELELSQKPVLTLFLSFFVLWFILETLYFWLLIKTLSKSSLALFPKYRESVDSLEWPAHAGFLRLKKSLEVQGFVRSLSLRANITASSFLRSTIFENKDKTLRVQAVFIPHKTQKFTVHFIITSKLDCGTLIVTDNVMVPFGGFTPESWLVQRFPLSASLDALIKKHLALIAVQGSKITPWEGSALDEINEQQALMESYNIDRGFLNNLRDGAQLGKITNEGQYRLWQEMWVMRYLGVSLFS